MIVETELYCYLRTNCTVPTTPYFHKNHLDLLEKWFEKNVIESKRIELYDEWVKSGKPITLNHRIKMIDDYRTQFKIVKVLFEINE